MSTNLSGVLAIDFQNMYHKAREHGNDFFVARFVEWIRSMYKVEDRDSHIFMSELFYNNMYPAARRYVSAAGVLHLCNRVRERVEYDPVDAQISRFLLGELRRQDIKHILLASSDGGFAHLGRQAWYWNKEFHLFPFADPSRKYNRGADQIMELRRLKGVSGTRY